MPIVYTAFVAGCLAANLQAPAGLHGVRPGMTQAAVEQLLGEPLFGYLRFSDPLVDRREARYREPAIYVTYERGVVTRVRTSHRAVILASGRE